MKNYFPIPDDCFELVLAYDGRYDKRRLKRDLLESLFIIDIRLVVSPDNIPEDDLEYLGEPSLLEKNLYYKFIETQTSWHQQICYHKKTRCCTDHGGYGVLSNFRYDDEVIVPKFSTSHHTHYDCCGCGSCIIDDDVE